MSALKAERAAERRFYAEFEEAGGMAEVDYVDPSGRRSWEEEYSEDPADPIHTIVRVFYRDRHAEFDWWEYPPASVMAFMKATGMHKGRRKRKLYPKGHAGELAFERRMFCDVMGRACDLEDYAQANAHFARYGANMYRWPSKKMFHQWLDVYRELTVFQRLLGYDYAYWCERYNRLFQMHRTRD